MPFIPSKLKFPYSTLPQQALIRITFSPITLPNVDSIRFVSYFLTMNFTAISFLFLIGDIFLTVMIVTFLDVKTFTVNAYFLLLGSFIWLWPVLLSMSTCYCTCSIFSFSKTSSFVTIAIKYQTFVSSNLITTLMKFIVLATFLVMFSHVKFVTRTFILLRLLSLSFLCSIFITREFSFMTFVIFCLIIIVGIELCLRWACSGRWMIFVDLIKSLKFVTCEIHCHFGDFSILNLTFSMTVYALIQKEMVKSVNHPLINSTVYPNQDPFFHQPHAQSIHTNDHCQTFSYHKKYSSFSYFMTLDFLLKHLLTYLSQLIQ